MNLFGNAQKYTEEGYIMVQLKAEDVPHHKEHQQSAKHLSLHIRDSGKVSSLPLVSQVFMVPDSHSRIIENSLPYSNLSKERP
jgi:hypothetical protein